MSTVPTQNTLLEKEQEHKKEELKTWSQKLVENKVKVKQLNAESKELRQKISEYMNAHRVKKFEKIHGTHQLIMTPRKKAPTLNQDFFEETFDEYRRDVSKTVSSKLKSDARVKTMEPQMRQTCFAIVEDVVAQVLDQEVVGKYIIDRKKELTTETKSLTCREHGKGGRKRKRNDSDEEQELPLPTPPPQPRNTRSRKPQNEFQKPPVF